MNIKIKNLSSGVSNVIINEPKKYNSLSFQNLTDLIKIFKKEFYNRKIIPIDCSELIWGFGAIHCLTQQEPK